MLVSSRAPRRSGWRRVLAAGTLVLLGGFGCAGNDPGGGSVTVTTAPGAPGARVTVDAVDNGFRPSTIRVPAGPLTVELVQRGRFRHNLLIEGIDDFVVEVGRDRDRDEATVELEAGTYEIWCDVPGHRAQGMVGAIVVGDGRSRERDPGPGGATG